MFTTMSVLLVQKKHTRKCIPRKKIGEYCIHCYVVNNGSIRIIITYLIVVPFLEAQSAKK